MIGIGTDIVQIERLVKAIYLLSVEIEGLVVFVTKDILLLFMV